MRAESSVATCSRNRLPPKQVRSIRESEHGSKGGGRESRLRSRPTKMTVASMCHISSAAVVRSPTFGFAEWTRSRGRRQPTGDNAVLGQTATRTPAEPLREDGQRAG